MSSNRIESFKDACFDLNFVELENLPRPSFDDVMKRFFANAISFLLFLRADILPVRRYLKGGGRGKMGGYILVLVYSSSA